MNCLWYSNDEMVSTQGLKGRFVFLDWQSNHYWIGDSIHLLDLTMNLFLKISIEVFGLVTWVFCIFGPTDDNCFRNNVTRNSNSFSNSFRSLLHLWSMGPFTWLVAEGCNHDISPLISPVDMVDITHKLCRLLHNAKSLCVWFNVVLVMAYGTIHF